MEILTTEFIYTKDGKTWHRIKSERPTNAGEMFNRINGCLSMWRADAFNRYHTPGEL